MLQCAINYQLPGRLEEVLPQLEWLLVQHQRHCWEQWRELVCDVLPSRQRQCLWRSLLPRPRLCRPWFWLKDGLKHAVARFL